jgi:hypothetical protein
MQAIERIRIFIDVPFFKPSAIVAYGLMDRHRTGHGAAQTQAQKQAQNVTAREPAEPQGAHIAQDKETGRRRRLAKEAA